MEDLALIFVWELGDNMSSKNNDKDNPTKDEVTPEHLYLDRRRFLETSIYASTALATFGTYKYFRGSSPSSEDSTYEPISNIDGEKTTTFDSVSNYNNFYEFSTSKEKVADAAKHWKIDKWNLSVSGLVENPIELSLEDLAKIEVEQRIYRFRCVEGWSMVIPWLGFPLQHLLEKVRPLSTAKYVSFESFYDPLIMPNARSAGIDFPYVEGLRLDEALHPLTFIATGLYGKSLPNQNGAPVRLVVPWKYGFKSIKSLVKIVLTDSEPKTTWNLASPKEYGFYSNVNPKVDHPRWSQASERRIGELSRRDTLMFNGYEKEVAQLYTGMDLKRDF